MTQLNTFTFIYVVDTFVYSNIKVTVKECGGENEVEGLAQGPNADITWPGTRLEPETF